MTARLEQMRRDADAMRSGAIAMREQLARTRATNAAILASSLSLLVEARILIDESRAGRERPAEGWPPAPPSPGSALYRGDRPASNVLAEPGAAWLIAKATGAVAVPEAPDRPPWRGWRLRADD